MKRSRQRAQVMYLEGLSQPRRSSTPVMGPYFRVAFRVSAVADFKLTVQSDGCNPAYRRNT